MKNQLHAPLALDIITQVDIWELLLFPFLPGNSIQYNSVFWKKKS